MKIKEFINYMLQPIINETLKRGYNTAVAFTCLCQCALETGWLKSELMRSNNAPFGIKYHINNDRYYEAWTTEYKNGQYVKCIAKFQAYDTIEQAIDDYFNLIGMKRYASALNCDTVKACITEIQKGGYATDPNYINSIMAVYDTVTHALRN